MSQITFRQAVIPISTTKSAGVDLQGEVVVGIYAPAAVTGANLTFEAAEETAVTRPGTATAGSYSAVKDFTGTTVTCPMGAGTCVQVPPATFLGVRYLKLVSDATELAARTFYVATRPY